MPYEFRIIMYQTGGIENSTIAYKLEPVVRDFIKRGYRVSIKPFVVEKTIYFLVEGERWVK